MSKCGSDIKLVKFYKKSSKMSGKGRGKSKKRDIITAPQIRPAPGKVKAAGNLPKNKKLTETKIKAKPKSSKKERIDLKQMFSMINLVVVVRKKVQAMMRFLKNPLLKRV